MRIMKTIPILYLNFSATSIKGDDSYDMSAVGMGLEAADCVAGVIKAQMILMESKKCGFVNLYCH